MYAIGLYMMRCTQNKFTVFFIGLSLLGRVTNPLTCSGLGRFKSRKSWVGSGWVTKSDPCPTLQGACRRVVAVLVAAMWADERRKRALRMALRKNTVEQSVYHTTSRLIDAEKRSVVSRRTREEGQLRAQLQQLQLEQRGHCRRMLSTSLD